MKLIKPSFEILEQGSGLDELYKHIERCGRLSYKSEDKITEESAKPFVDRMVNSKHGAVLEHGTVYLNFVSNAMDPFNGAGKYQSNPYSKVNSLHIGIELSKYFITTNYRVLVENGWLNDLKYLCDPTEYHEPRISVKFTCSRSISHELVRHRVFSFIQESQRYCNYSKGKYDEGVTFIIPSWNNIKPYTYFISTNKEGEDVIKDTRKQEDMTDLTNKDKDFESALMFSELLYLDLIKDGCKPQEAREVLLNATKTEIIMTGFLSDWVGNEEEKKGFFPLRCDSTAYPDMSALAIPLKEEFIKRGWINE